MGRPGIGFQKALTVDEMFVSRPTCRFRGTIRRFTVGAAITLQAAGGCAIPLPRWGLGGWVADYESAEKQVRRTGDELMIYYKHVTADHDDPMYEALKAPAVKRQTREYVRCVLSPSYEPDRRYVAQYGVERAPALIVIHRDGTYHAGTGVMTESQIVQFLNDAVGPGSKPAINPYILREPDYAWHRSLEAAEEEARETGRSILIVLDRWPSRDWRRLKVMLARREVYSRVADMVHCRPGSMVTSAGGCAARFGVANLPAIVVVRPDGSHSNLELPTGYESIARFVDRAEAGPPGEGPVAALAGPAAASQQATEASAGQTTSP